MIETGCRGLGRKGDKRAFQGKCPPKKCASIDQSCKDTSRSRQELQVPIHTADQYAWRSGPGNDSRQALRRQCLTKRAPTYNTSRPGQPEHLSWKIPWTLTMFGWSSSWPTLMNERIAKACVQQFAHSNTLAHSLTDLMITHSLNHPPTQPTTHPPTQPLSHPPTHRQTRARARSLAGSQARSHSIEKAKALSRWHADT